MIILLLLLALFGLALFIWMIEGADEELSPHVRHISSNTKRTSQDGFKVSSFLFLLCGIVIITLPITLNPYKLRRTLSIPEPNQGNEHLSSHEDYALSFPSKPSTSGPHLSEMLPWGIYDQELSDEALLHNKEDGGVVLWYQQGSPAQNEQRVETLTALARLFPNTIIVPRENLESTYMLTAWRQRLSLNEDELSGKKISTFLNTYSQDKEEH